MKKHIEKLKTPNILGGWAMVLENNGLKIYFISGSYQDAKFLFNGIVDGRIPPRLVSYDAKVFAEIYASYTQKAIRQIIEEKTRTIIVDSLTAICDTRE